jgi:peptidyl-prolyl cis-trans isomerase C
MSLTLSWLQYGLILVCAAVLSWPAAAAQPIASPLTATPSRTIRPLPAATPPRRGGVVDAGQNGAAADGTGGPAAPRQDNADPVIGSVEGHLIYLSDLAEAAKTLPENLRGLPFDTLYPVLLDRMIDHESLVLMARHNGLEERKQVQHDIQSAIERILEGAYLGEVTAPTVTEASIQTRYNRQFANRPATEEVRARHILVTTEAEARKVLDDLKKGGDFATLARLVSKDPDAAKGGDLGFFRREQVWPNFADVAFSVQPGQIAPDPVKNEFGWHVVRIEEKRLIAPPAFSEIHEQLRQELLAAAVQQAIEEARTALVIHRFNLDGSELDNGPHLGTAIPLR